MLRCRIVKQALCVPKYFRGSEKTHIILCSNSFSRDSKENYGSRIGRRLDKTGVVGSGNSWTVPSYPYFSRMLLSFCSLPEGFFCGVMLGPASFSSCGEAAFCVEF